MIIDIQFNTQHLHSPLHQYQDSIVVLGPKKLAKSAVNEPEIVAVELQPQHSSPHARKLSETHSTTCPAGLSNHRKPGDRASSFSTKDETRGRPSILSPVIEVQSVSSDYQEIQEPEYHVAPSNLEPLSNTSHVCTEKPTPPDETRLSPMKKDDKKQENKMVDSRPLGAAAVIQKDDSINPECLDKADRGQQLHTQSPRRDSTRYALSDSVLSASLDGNELGPLSAAIISTSDVGINSESERKT